MTGTLAPRLVVVTRPTDLELLVAEHGTREQARFATSERIGWFAEAERRDGLQREALAGVLRAIPLTWRRAHIQRDDLATFAFAPEDIVVPVGQDGLVANVAKYLTRQFVIGVNPDPANVEGTLVRFAHDEFAATLKLVAEHRVAVEERTLIEARLGDGQTLHALNEIFIGHRSHQSARYRIQLGEREERQASSGVIVTSGTGATGWARSICHDRNLTLPLDPVTRTIAVLVREAIPAPNLGASLTAAILNDGAVRIISEMGDGGVIFGDGIEADFLSFRWGLRVEVSASRVPLMLVSKRATRMQSTAA